MIIDERNEFADATSIGTPNNATVNVGDVVDLLIIGRDAGQGQPLYLVIIVDTAPDSATDTGQVSFLLSSDSTGTLAVDGTQTTHWESDRFLANGTTLLAGSKFVVPLPANFPTWERFFGIQVRNSVADAVNAGAISAFLTLDPTGWKAYPDAVN